MLWLGLGHDVGRVLHDVAWCFAKNDVQIEVGWNVRSQERMNDDGDVLGSGVDVLELEYIKIEILVVEPVQDVLLDRGRQDSEIDHVPDGRVNGATDAYGELVVVAVRVRVVAFAIDLRIFGVAQRRIVNAVCCIEVLVAIHGNAWAA